MTATPTAPQATSTDGFDAFYRRTRTRLLVQTWALTGDRPAAVKAVRDAYVACAHHWGKVSLLDDAHADTGGSEREDWLRPIAWSRAQSRHTVPHFHRAAEVTPEAAATLAAVHSLSSLHRRVLLLSHLSTANLSQLAREVGLSTRRAERELHTAITRFAAQRNVAPGDVQACFEPLFANAVLQPWPDANSLVRIGQSRRTIHRAAGALAISAACLGTGIWVSGSQHNQLSDAHWDSVVREPAVSVSARSLVPITDLATLGDVTGTVKDGATPILPSTAITSSDAHVLGCLGTAGDTTVGNEHVAQWRTAANASNTGWVTEAVRSSGDAATASKDYKALLAWYDGCPSVRLQLRTAYLVKGVGDQATLLELHNYDGNGRNVFVGVAQTGSLTAIVGSSQHNPLTAVTAASGLATLTQHLCGQAGAGTKNCTPNPRAFRTSVPHLLAYPGLLSTVDLPPIPGITKPWIAGQPGPASINGASTTCDNATTFKTASASLTKTFAFPDLLAKTAKPHLSERFGVVESIGKFGSAAAAQAFQTKIRSAIDNCGAKILGSHVSVIPVAGLPTGTNAYAWKVVSSTDEKSTITFYMAAITAGSSAAQLNFVPDGQFDMTEDSFAKLVVRAATRLQAY